MATKKRSPRPKEAHPPQAPKVGLPDPGDLLAVPLEDGFWGACRVTARGKPTAGHEHLWRAGLNAMRPIIINAFLHSARVLGDACDKLRRFSVEGTRLAEPRIHEMLGRSLMLVTALLRRRQ